MKLARLSAAFTVVSLLTFGLEQAARAAGPDPAADAQRLIQKLDTPEARLTVKDPLAKAKAAQHRAQNARAAGDLPHATELDLLALTWAEVADDLLRAAASEKQLAELQKSVSDLEQRAVRTQALIEQTIARRGRAEQNLASVSAAAKSPANATKSPAPPEPATAKTKPSTRAVKP